MFYPSLKAFPEKVYSVESFGGLITGENTPENSFCEMENLSGKFFPKMSIREKRGFFADEKGNTAFSVDSEITCAVNTASGILIITEDSVFLDGKKIEGITLTKGVKKRSAVNMGRNIFIIPDGVYIKVSENGAAAVHCNFTKSLSDAAVNFCYPDGTDVFPSHYGNFPEKASIGDELVISSENSMELYSYSGSEWIKSGDLFIRLSVGDVTPFSAGQTVYIDTDSTDILSGCYTIKSVLGFSLVLEGVIAHESESITLKIKSEIPRMDFIVEHNNRLWGCRYGENNNGDFVNEIYASKSGEPMSWYSFNGISTDSYMANLGCPGEFTGAAALGNEVIFFKEEYIIRISGFMPSEFQVMSIPARGVEKGAHGSVVSLNERIFYKNSEGIMLYDGTFPVNISSHLSSERFIAHTASGIDGKYVVSMTDSDGERGLYIFDAVKGVWYREDDSFCVKFIFQRKGSLLFVCEKEDECRFFVMSYEDSKSRAEKLLSEAPFTIVPEKEVFWSALTGITGVKAASGKEKIRSFYITLALGEEAFLEISIITDENSEKEKIFFLDRKTNGVVRIPVNVPPCVKSRLYFSGKGECTVHRIERVVRISGEVKNID